MSLIQFVMLAFIVTCVAIAYILILTAVRKSRTYNDDIMEQGHRWMNRIDKAEPGELQSNRSKSTTKEK